jgi:hypothetical protein
MKKGFAPLVVIVAVLIVLFGLIAVLFLSTNHVGEDNLNNDKMMGEEMTDIMPSPSPVSSATDTATLEQELDATVTGSVDTDINSMQKDASGL